jgi:iron complex outermembrane receptor protein
MTGRSTSLRHMVSLAAVAMACATGTTALAQPAPPDDNGGLPEIIVTAEKRSQNILKVPASVSFISSENLTAQGAKSLQDYGAYVPGLQIDSLGTPGQSTITLRGIAPLGSGTAVGTYIDDAPLGSSSFYTSANLFQLDLLPYDVRGVEVLRGPQGTLYGASTMGGLLKYALIKADPSKLSGAVGGEVSTIHGAGDVGLGGRAMVNVPIVQDRLALRASGFYQKSPGYMDDVNRGIKDVNDYKQYGGRLALAIKPAEDVEITLDGLYQKIDSDGNAISLLDANPASPTYQKPLFGDLKTSLAQDEPFRQTTGFLKGVLTWDLPFGSFTAVSSYSRVRSRQGVDISFAYGPVIESIIGQPGLSGQYLDITVRKFTQELRLASAAGGTFEWMIGAFYTRERSTNDQLVTALDVNFQPTVLDPLLTASLPTRYREIAGFGNLTWNLTEALSVTGGLRYSHNSQVYKQFTGGAFGIGNGGGKSSENVTTYSVSGKYQIDPNVMAYARVASGYQPGGANVAAANVPPTVGPSRLTNYEAGLKGRLLDGLLTVDMALFRMDWKDIQVRATTPPPENIGYLVNAGRARSEGLEAAVQVRPDSHLTLGANFVYTKARFTVSIPSLAVGPGDRLPHVPRYTASATADYDFDLAADWAASLGGGVRYTGNRISSAAPPIYPERRYVAVDTHARLVHGDWKLGLFAKNLFDKRAYITKQDLIGATTFGSILQPRTIGLSVDRSF